MIGPHTCCSPHCKPQTTGEDKLAGALTDGSGTFASTPIPAVSCAPAAALTLATSAPASINELFKKFMKTYLEAQTQIAQGQVES